MKYNRFSPGKALMMLVFAAILYIVVTDAGHSAKNSAGAGDIWWAQIPQIEEAYQNLTNH